MSICAEMICAMCSNKLADASICYGCIDYDAFDYTVAFLDDALEQAQEAEAALNDKAQSYIQENTNLRAKLEATERQIRGLKDVCRRVVVDNRGNNSRWQEWCPECEKWVIPVWTTFILEGEQMEKPVCKHCMSDVDGYGRLLDTQTKLKAAGE